MADQRDCSQCEYVYYAPEGLTIPDYRKYGFAYTMLRLYQKLLLMKLSLQ